MAYFILVQSECNSMARVTMLATNWQATQYVSASNCAEAAKCQPLLQPHRNTRGLQAGACCPRWLIQTRQYRSASPLAWPGPVSAEAQAEL